MYAFMLHTGSRAGLLLHPTTCPAEEQVTRPLIWDDFAIVQEKDATSLLIRVRISKSEPNHTPDRVIAFLQKPNSICCPVSAFLAWKNIAKPVNGQMTVSHCPDLGHYSYNQFRSNLLVRVSAIGLNTKLYCTHSFRATFLTLATMAKVPDSMIRYLANWSPNSRQPERYFRPSAAMTASATSAFSALFS